MSDAARQNLKVSREGIVLIKSFEGFRPRAIQRAEGGWIIGYGHTLSAREGATVSEADAELLLRYDLLPVEASVNDTVPAQLNQHQFDALVSFAFSVGVDRFASSDVRQRLAAGAPGEAADAIMGWPEPTLPDAALRRRAAERALFVANPGTPVALSDLLSAPLPPPPVPTPVEAPQAEPVAEAEPVPAEPAPVEPIVEAAPTPGVDVEPDAEPIAPVDPRGAAVAALLGEQPARLVQDETIIPTFGSPAPVAPPAPSNDNPPVEAATEDAQPEVEALADDAELQAGASAPEPVEDAADTVLIEAPEQTQAPAAPAPTSGAAGWTSARYAPYNLSMVGPLPYLQPAAPRAVSEAATLAQSVFEVSPVEEETAPTAEAPTEIVEAPTGSEPVEPAEDAVLTDIDATPVEDAAPSPDVDAPIETAETEIVEPAVETAAAAIDEAPVIEPVAIAEPEPAAPVGPMVYVAPAPVAELVLTPLDDAPEPAFARPLWSAEERDAPDGSENNLFGEDLTLTLGGSVMRHEMEFEAPARFDWKETAPFIFMGGVGLVSFGASMAAFRRAAEQSGGSELTIIGWVLALIGLGCVGVSSINLYRKFGLPGGD
ncbi:glycoside hydrolase family protein [Brevundimonas sp.]